jgi:hypothetical protein
MPKSGAYGRPSTRSTKKVATYLGKAPNAETTLNAAHARARRNDDLYDKMPSLGTRRATPASELQRTAKKNAQGSVRRSAKPKK